MLLQTKTPPPELWHDKFAYAEALLRLRALYGFDGILIETVGAGQAEVDVARLAHTTLVVEAPGMGDDIQAIKAGILEIADILVINKADRPGVDTTERTLRAMLEMAHPGGQDAFRNCDAEGGPAPWNPPVLRTIATEGVGISGLKQAIDDHRRYLEQSGEWTCRENARIQAEVEGLLREKLLDCWRSALPEGAYESMLEALERRNLSPIEAVEQLVNRWPSAVGP